LNFKKLAIVADFFQFEGMSETVGWRGRFERNLGEVNARLQLREDDLRWLFARSRSNSELADPNENLIYFFDQIDLYNADSDTSVKALLNAPVVFRTLAAKYLERLLKKNETGPGSRGRISRSVSASLGDFRATLNEYAEGSFIGTPDWNHVLVAGGSVLASLLYKHSEQARAPRTNGPRDVPRCEAVSLLQKPLHYKEGGQQKIVPSFYVCGPWPSCYPRPRLIQKVLDRGAQAVVRGATHVLDRGVQAVARGAARCALDVHGRGAKADDFGRSFAVLSTQVPTVGLRLRHSKLACGSMLKVSRDAVAAGEGTNRQLCIGAE
jgi:hypothetical protein